MLVLLQACPAGRYSAVNGTVSRDACLPCESGRFSSQLAATSAAACVPCEHPLENSDAGSARCWPGVVSVTASDPVPSVIGLSNDDEVTVVFTRATDKPASASAWIA